jgi:hypothetical protein
MTSKFEIPPKYCESPANKPRYESLSRLGPLAPAVIGAALRALYDDPVQSRIPEAQLALIDELQSKEEPCGR